jgi:hypothetical protein
VNDAADVLPREAGLAGDAGDRHALSVRPSAAEDVHLLRLLLIPQISQTQIKMPAAMTASATQSCQLSGGTICSS